ncbi:uncharacterized protein [Magallana gigas]|uniref:uncharacterized protein n=1 Tax=Magallana gigas TaxID=29159 RepID=UPI00333F04A0
MEFFSSHTIVGMQHISEVVFVVMCQRVGTSEEIVFRREAMDIKEVVDRRVTAKDGLVHMLSGSMREGFRLEGSDVDMMYWQNNHRVIMDMSQSEFYNKANTTLILSDSSESPPGFTLLQLLTPTTDSDVQSACVIMNDKVYISSSIYRQLTCSIISPDSTEHGPCGNSIRGSIEYDYAWCFVCDSWPLAASSWINRCHSWPDPEVINDIVRNGCHFVAIGNQFGPHENEEWRISFSQAEYKLVYSMNHCQFLTYGLLKLFLKEVINQQSDETSKLLCSYHMKTAIFWAIQQNIQPHWCAQNFLAGFWVCFKLLLKWVYEGICPNFFIPQNNMFLTKVHGSAQNRLFIELYQLYNKGMTCLLESYSIGPWIIYILYNHRSISFIDTDESTYISDSQYDAERVIESMPYFNTNILPRDLCQITKVINTIEQLIESPLSHYQVVVLQKLTSYILYSTAFLLQNMYTYSSVNKQMYIADKQSYHMLKLAAKFGYVSDTLYIAMYYYKTLRYREALSVIEMTKVKLAQPYLMYDGHVDRERYTEAVGGLSWSRKLRQAVAEDIVLTNRICFISELIPEQQSAIQNKMPILAIPVFVMLHFLEFLCYRHIDTTVSHAALYMLQDLVHHETSPYVRDVCKDISWEILGICQQITGNPQAALYSYQQSLITQHPRQIETATQRRIHEIVLSTSHQ